MTLDVCRWCREFRVISDSLSHTGLNADMLNVDPITLLVRSTMISIRTSDYLDNI